MTRPTALLTGASGFLGKILAPALAREFELVTLGRSDANTIRADLAAETPTIRFPVNLVVHAAAKAHAIPHSPREQEAFLQTNAGGTARLLDSLAQLPHPPASIVFVSSVAVYGRSAGELLDETTPLSGVTPYAQSKIDAERFLTAWCAQRSVGLTVLRLPLLIGPEPPGNLGALVRSLRRRTYFGIGSGAARKSLLLADDLASALVRISRIPGVYNLTDGNHPTMREIETRLAYHLGRSPPFRVPLGAVRWVATLGDLIGPSIPLNSATVEKLSSTLTFCDRSARRELGWSPRPALEHLPAFGAGTMMEQG